MVYSSAKETTLAGSKQKSVPYVTQPIWKARELDSGTEGRTTASQGGRGQNDGTEQD